LPIVVAARLDAEEVVVLLETRRLALLLDLPRSPPVPADEVVAFEGRRINGTIGHDWLSSRREASPPWAKAVGL
jgi:hypothetical protein